MVSSRAADQTWLRPPREVVEQVEFLLGLGKSDTAIKNHSTMVEYTISEDQIADIRSDYEAAREWEVRPGHVAPLCLSKCPFP